MATLAPALAQLRAQIDARFPTRSKASDGWIGNAAHQARGGAAASQHNPNAQGVVCAIDVTEDHSVGLDCNRLMEELDASNDDRIFYLIHDYQIDNSDDSRTPYNGPNPHTKHIHISTWWNRPEVYNDARPWNIPMLGDAPAPAPVPAPSPGGIQFSAEAKSDQFNLRDTGFDPGPIDGYWGQRSTDACKRFQFAARIAVDGVCGPATRSMLRKVPSWRTAPDAAGDGGYSALRWQTELKRHGWHIETDNRWGPHSTSILRQFQAEKGVTADGVRGPQSWTTLFCTVN